MLQFVRHQFSSCIQILQYLMIMHDWIPRYRGRSPQFQPAMCICNPKQILHMHIFRGSSTLSCNQCTTGIGRFAVYHGRRQRTIKRTAKVFAVSRRRQTCPAT